MKIPAYIKKTFLAGEIYAHLLYEPMHVFQILTPKHKMFITKYIVHETV